MKDLSNLEGVTEVEEDTKVGELEEEDCNTPTTELIFFSFFLLLPRNRIPKFLRGSSIG
jgi:hypothetical protein